MKETQKYKLYTIEVQYNAIYIKKIEKKIINKTKKNRYIHIYISAKKDITLKKEKNVKLWFDYEKKENLTEEKYRIKHNTCEKIILELSPQSEIILEDIFSIKENRYLDLEEFMYKTENELIQLKIENKNLRENLEDLKRSIKNLGDCTRENFEMVAKLYGDNEKIKEFFESSSIKEQILYIGDNPTYTSLKNIYDILNLQKKDIVPLIEYVRENFKRFEKPQFLLVESMWSGLKNDWSTEQLVSNKFNLKILTEELKKYNIKTVFYNKEDPYHFKEFKWIAKMSDLIITVDESTINKYNKYYSNKKVIYNSFIINEEEFKFQGLKSNKKIYFAGNYYNNRFEKRKIFLNEIFDYVIEKNYEFEIIDRNYKNKNTTFGFPQKYDKFIKTGGLEIELLNKYISKFSIGINVNSITDTNTFVSRRLLEHIALGKVMISNYSYAVEKLDISTVIYSKTNNMDEIFKKLEVLLKDDKLEDMLKENSERILDEYGSKKFKQKIKKII